MTRYSVSGILTPDATTADTGVAAGTHNGQPYWEWNDWYLLAAGTPGRTYWVIANRLSQGFIENSSDRVWRVTSGGPIGEYNPVANMGTIGTATVAEITEPTPTEYAVLTINDGPLAGQYIVLKKR